MRQGVAETIKSEWKQMTFLHKVRFTVCINAMVLFSWAYMYTMASKIVFNLIAYHYATTELYRDSTAMKANLTTFYDMTFYATVIFDLIVYGMVMIGLILLASRKVIFSTATDAMCIELSLKKKKKPEQSDTEAIDTAYDVMVKPEHIDDQVDKIIKEKKES